MLNRIRQTHPIACLLLICGPVLLAGIALRILIIDVPGITRVCADSQPPYWCSLRSVVIDSRVYAASIVSALLAIRYNSLHLSCLAIAIGLFGLFSFNPNWSHTSPDWSICGLILGLLAYLRCGKG